MLEKEWIGIKFFNIWINMTKKEIISVLVQVKFKFKKN